MFNVYLVIFNERAKKWRHKRWEHFVSNKQYNEPSNLVENLCKFCIESFHVPCSGVAWIHTHIHIILWKHTSHTHDPRQMRKYNNEFIWYIVLLLMVLNVLYTNTGCSSKLCILSVLMFGSCCCCWRWCWWWWYYWSLFGSIL